MNAVDEESQLVINACRGSIEAFEVLVTLYEPRIRRMIYGMTHDAQLAQDLCQETFLSAYRALARMDGEQLHFAPWLYRIALNQVRSEWRRRKHVTLLPLSARASNAEDADELGELFLLRDEPFEDRVLERELVKRVLAQLPANSAACLLLDAEGYTYQEIADTLQDSVSAVRSRLSRARQAFQQLYRRLDRERV